MVMHPLRHTLPSLNRLYALDAVGRHLSFTGAAAELGVSQPAVSKSIRLLEESLGSALFSRNHRGLSLTPEGRILLDESRRLLTRLADVTQSLQPHGDKKKIRVSFSSSFISLWLLPRVPEFQAAHPSSISFTFDECTRELEMREHAGYDLSSRLGYGHWDGLDSWFLAQEKICAVASPEFLKNNLSLATHERINEAALLHATEPNRKRMTWASWFHAAGQDYSVGGGELEFSDYHSAIEAALLGQGVALGWEHLISHFLADGRLVRFTDLRVETDQSIYLVASKERRFDTHHEWFRDWIISRTASELRALE